MLIPKRWRDTVREILESCDASRIVVTVRAKRDWEATFPLAFEFEMYMVLAEALKDENLEGKRVVGMTPPGEVYEFFFNHQDRKLYGKVNLLPNGKLVIIYSAHVPLKGDAL